MSRIFKSLVIKEFGIIPSKLYDSIRYSLWIKHGRYKIVDPKTYEDDPNYPLTTLDEEEFKGIELITFMTYENIAKFFDGDYWYYLIIQNVIDSNDTDL